MTAHLDGVSVALPSRFHSSRLPDIRNTVDGVLFAVLPDQFSWEHHAIGIEICVGYVKNGEGKDEKSGIAIIKYEKTIQ